ncbi:uroporphyrinogen decarboxylase [Agaricicola taiwanensis]|uniref:Uroporphyrinogen decarboxylase n=1 Tax=Agaricicola taiwanensis TaxID=591372 RepID=A0A8J2VKE0_9RHOB|nr:uroporphyrinogen decarboxylase [Agaricicola taiwanensis]GGE28825.1 uroporphyrinogen decarboxylase [Agaricicola taiwanensis]
MADKPLLQTLRGEITATPPIWFMRQAGRYLPEYRAVRSEAGSFLDLCYAPDKAAEVTLQPIRRFHFDAAILFADILLVPQALGQDLSFVENEGPRLDPVQSREDILRLSEDLDLSRLGRVYETVSRVKEGLPPGVALIGFCGAPWTVATYMVSGGKDRLPALLWARRDPEGFGLLVDRLVAASIDYLSGQIVAGAEVVQIFDSWAGELPPDLFAAFCVAPMRAITAAVKERHPGVPVIAFARGAGTRTASTLSIGADGLGLDTGEDPRVVRQLVGPRIALQGNLDPLALLVGGTALDRAVDAVCDAMEGSPYVFNLGHGIRPDTPPDNVARAIARVRNREP